MVTLIARIGRVAAKSPRFWGEPFRSDHGPYPQIGYWTVHDHTIASLHLTPLGLDRKNRVAHYLDINSVQNWI
jgi:hypothetical protein